MSFLKRKTISPTDVPKHGMYTVDGGIAVEAAIDRAIRDLPAGGAILGHVVNEIILAAKINGYDEANDTVTRDLIYDAVKDRCTVAQITMVTRKAVR